MLELARLLVDPVFLAQSGVPRGDGRPVVLLPGFLAGDQTLAILAAWLRRLGYAFAEGGEWSPGELCRKFADLGLLSGDFG